MSAVERMEPIIIILQAGVGTGTVLLFATIGVAGVAFVVVASALKVPELNDIIAAFQRRLRRKRAR